MNKKGFTLVEVLAVITILAIVVAIITPSISRILKENKNNKYQLTEQTIIDYMNIYNKDHEETIWSNNNNTYQLEINTLKDKFPNLKIPKECQASNLIITQGINPKSNSKYDYSVCLICKEGNSIAYKSQKCE